MKKLLFFAALSMLLTDIHIAQAGIVRYNVSVIFLDDTKFTGTFDYDAATQQVTNLQGKLDDTLMGNIEPLNYQIPSPSSQSDGKGGINATVYELNTSAIATNPPINNNAYVTINFNAQDPTLGATDMNQLAYMDCSPGGLMGQTCMYHLSWHNPVFPMAGGHGVLSQTITLADSSSSGQSSSSDCLFNWAERNYTQFLSPVGSVSQTMFSYYFRFYKNTNSYLGISSVDNQVYFMGPNGNMVGLGALSNWLSTAGC